MVPFRILCWWRLPYHISVLGADDTLPMPLQTATTAAAANHSPSVAVVLVQDCVCNGDLVLPWDVAQGLTGGMAAQLVHHRAAAAHPAATSGLALGPPHAEGAVRNATNQRPSPSSTRSAAAGLL